MFWLKTVTFHPEDWKLVLLNFLLHDFDSKCIYSWKPLQRLSWFEFTSFGPLLGDSFDYHSFHTVRSSKLLHFIVGFKGENVTTFDKAEKTFNIVNMRKIRSLVLQSLMKRFSLSILRLTGSRYPWNIMRLII